MIALFFIKTIEAIAQPNTLEQKEFLDKLRASKNQPYYEVLENVIGDYKLYRKQEVNKQ